METVVVVGPIEPLILELTEEQASLIRRAAEACGASMDEYIARHAFEAARDDLSDLRIFIARDDAWDDIHAMLDSPTVFTPVMQELLSSPTVLEDEAPVASKERAF